MTLNQKKTKIHHKRLLPDELLILWGCWSGSHECVKYTYIVFSSITSQFVCFHWRYWARILWLIHFGLLVRVVFTKPGEYYLTVSVF